MSHIQVATYDDRFLAVQLLQETAEIIVPRHAVVQSLESVLRVGCVNRYKVKIFHFQRDDSSFVVVLVNAQTVGNRQRLVACKDSRARVSFFLGIIPVRGITLKAQVKLSGLHFGFLQAEKVGIQLVKSITETFIATGAESVHIP